MRREDATRRKTRALTVFFPDTSTRSKVSGFCLHLIVVDTRVWCRVMCATRSLKERCNGYFSFSLRVPCVCVRVCCCSRRSASTGRRTHANQRQCLTLSLTKVGRSKPAFLDAAQHVPVEQRGAQRQLFEFNVKCTKRRPPRTTRSSKSQCAPCADNTFSGARRCCGAECAKRRVL